MTTHELIAYLTEGLDDDQANAVRNAFKNSKVAERAGSLKAAKDFDDLAARESALKAELEGGPEKPGAKAYRDWYEKNYAAVQALQTEKAALIEKYGTVDAPKTAAATLTAGEKPTAGMTEADIQRMVDQRIQTGYAPRWSDLLTGMGGVVQKHMFSGRKAPIDMKKLSELAQANGGDLDRAYDEYDKPEREKQAKVDEDKRIETRVNEELQKRGAHQHFPADMTPGTLSRNRDASKFDKGAMERELVNTFISGEEGGGKPTGFGVN